MADAFELCQTTCNTFMIGLAALKGRSEEHYSSLEKKGCIKRKKSTTTVVDALDWKNNCFIQVRKKNSLSDFVWLLPFVYKGSYKFRGLNWTEKTILQPSWKRRQPGTAPLHSHHSQWQLHSVKCETSATKMGIQMSEQIFTENQQHRGRLKLSKYGN